MGPDIAAGGRGRWATPQPSPSTPLRILAHSGMAAPCVPMTRCSRRACVGCVTSANGARGSMWSSVTTSVWTVSRQRCCVSSCRTWIAGTARAAHTRSATRNCFRQPRECSMNGPRAPARITFFRCGSKRVTPLPRGSARAESRPASTIRLRCTDMRCGLAGACVTRRCSKPRRGLPRSCRSRCIPIFDPMRSNAYAMPFMPPFPFRSLDGEGPMLKSISSPNAISGAPSTDPIGVAVVGLGYWGPNLLRVLADTPNVEVRWICDLDRERLAKFEHRYPAARVTTHYANVLADSSVGAVIIATPVHTHYDLAAQALRAGKHVFVEKPLASSSALADHLAELANGQQRTLMCGHTFIYSPPVRAIKRMLEAGTLGDIYFISSSRVNLGLHQRDVSVIWDLGPHDFSILLYWLGELPATVRAVGRDSIVPGIADVAFVSLTFGSGIVANVELSWLAPSKLRRTVLVGSERMVTYDDGAVEPVRVFDSGVVYQDPETFGEYHLSYRSGDIVSPKIESHEPLGLELEDFLGAIRRGETMEFHTELARNVVRIVEAADR